MTYGCVDCDTMAVENILDIHKYLMEKNNIQWYLDLLRKCLL